MWVRLHVRLIRKDWLFFDEFCVLTRQAKLGVDLAVAPYPTDFNVGDVCKLVCHTNLRTPSQYC